MSLGGRAAAAGRVRTGSVPPSVSGPLTQLVSAVLSSVPLAAWPTDPTGRGRMRYEVPSTTTTPHTLSLFSNACFLNCSNTELEAVDSCVGFGGPRGLVTSSGGLPGGLFLRGAIDGVVAAGGLTTGWETTGTLGGDWVV